MLPVLVFFAGLIALAAASVVGADMRRLSRALDPTAGKEMSRG